MKIIKKCLVILMAMVLALPLFACGKKSEATAKNETKESTAEPVVEYPERICSGYIISTSTLLALGLKDKLVGIEAKADKRNIYKLSYPEIIDLPSIGSAKEPDMEACIAQEPDLVILPKKLKDEAKTLEALGIKVLLVNPESQELLNEMIMDIAKLTGTEARAKELIKFADDKKNWLADSLAGVAAPTVYFAGNEDLLSTAGGQMYQSDLVTMAGGRNVAADLDDTYWAKIDYEQLLAWNPEYIIIASDASYDVQDVMDNENLADVAAVKNNKVFKMPNKAENWDTPIPSGILGAVWMAFVMHPDSVSEEECATIIDKYYEEFYGFTYSEK